MPRLLIIADDLTGAADSAVAFGGRGIETIVLLLDRSAETSIGPLIFQSADVVAVDADTRCLDAEDAAKLVAKLVRSCGSMSSDPDWLLIYKKVDSTLRRNVAAELAAVLRARRAQAPPSTRIAMVFAPAFPALGRTTLNGRQRMHTQRLERERKVDADIAAMLSEAGLSCTVIGLGHIRSEASALQNVMRHVANLSDVLICDAETEDDLRAIAGAAMRLDNRTVWAGSAGLARHITDTAPFASLPRSAPNPLRRPDVVGPTLFVVGSPSPESCEQAQALAGAPDIACVTLPITAALPGERSPDWQHRGSLITRILPAAKMCW